MRNAVLFAALLLAACSSVTPYYQEKNFAQPVTATRLSFDEAKVVCRSRTLDYHWMGDTQDLNIPRYTKCMTSEGYAFTGPKKQL